MPDPEAAVQPDRGIGAAPTTSRSGPPAVSSGVPVVRVPGAGRRDALKAHGADVVVDDLAEREKDETAATTMVITDSPSW